MRGFLFKSQKRKSLKATYDGTKRDDRRGWVPIEQTGEEGQLPSIDRLNGIAQCRDGYRNFSATRSLVNTICRYTVGDKGKLRMSTGNDEWDREAGAYFNQEWAPSACGRTGQHWSEMLRTILAAVITDGDALVSIDNWLANDGRMLVWEADQICDMAAGDWRKHGAGRAQNQGVITDKYGRVDGYIVTGKRGLVSVAKEHCSILSPENCRLVYSAWRPTQYRGASELLPVIRDMRDIYEMRGKEIQTAKVACELAGYTKGKNSLEQAILRGGEDIDEILGQIESGESGGGGEVSTPEHRKKIYEKLEALSGGKWFDIGTEEEMHVLDHNRPNLNVETFGERVLQGAGASLGLGKSYALLTPAGSYVAFRGDSGMTWASFRERQKRLERQLCDWVAERVISRAVIEGNINPPPVDLPWQRGIGWEWPEPPMIDPVREVNARVIGLKNMLTNYSRELGSGWRDILRQRAAENEMINDLGLTQPGETGDHNQQDKEEEE